METADLDVTKSVAVVESERVEQLSKLLNQQQEIIYRQQHISSYFAGDSCMLKVAEKTWEQIHPNIGSAVETKYRNLFTEFATLEKLEKIDQLKGSHRSSAPAWRPSGIPNEDHATAACVEAKDMLAEFESRYLEVQKVTFTLQQTLKERREHLQKLESQIKSQLKDITERLPTTP